MLKRMNLFLIGILFLLTIPLTRAGSSSASLTLAYPVSQAVIDVGLSPSLNTRGLVSIEISYLPDSFPVALNLYSLIIGLSDYGPLPFAHSGLGLAYYPFGAGTERVQINDDVRLRVKKWNFYLGVGAGIATLFFKELEKTGTRSASQSLGLKGTSGVNFPVLDSLRAGIEIGAITTLQATGFYDEPLSFLSFFAGFRIETELY